MKTAGDIPTIHLVGNAHLDPVWLWDWREGMTEAITTSRTILDLMDERPELTFVRGESLHYEHIERHDPATFARIRAQVDAGRWDVVGGTYVQADENLPSTSTLIAQFERGHAYFARALGVTVRAAWSPDAYGHSAGYPEILSVCGIRYFAFTRPGAAHLPLEKPAFRWRGDGGAEVLAYRMGGGWYGNERDEIPRRLDACLADLRASGLSDVPCFYGLGNHGGGPTRRHLDEIRVWSAAHPEVRVLHSGLHRFFEALEPHRARLPVLRGELNFSLRGTYVSHARVKRAYREAEAELERAEHVAAAVGSGLGLPPADLAVARDGVLFNSFHDIVTGSSTERVLNDQVAWLGGSLHGSQRAILDTLTALSRRVDSRVPRPVGDAASAVCVLVFNPHPHAYRGPLELEAPLDYRPLFAWRGRPTRIPLVVRDPAGRAVPFQFVSPEHLYARELPWRMRVLLTGTVPSLGYAVYRLGLEDRPRSSAGPGSVRASRADTIEGESLRVAARAGDRGVHVWRDGRLLLGKEGLTAVTVADPWGSEGGMNEEPESVHLDRVVARWKVTAVRVLERGPLRASLWVRMSGGHSRLELTLRVTAGRPALGVEARLLWNERSARLKLVLPWGDPAQFEVPGGSIWRGQLGEVPGLRWVRVRGRRGLLGFASDVLYGFDCARGQLRVSVARATRYGTDAVERPDEAPWHPVGDAGELKFRFLLCDGGPQLERLAAELDSPPVTLPIPANTGDLGRSGSFGELTGPGLRLVRLAPLEGGGARAWVQNTGARAASGRLTWLGRHHAITRLAPGAIRPLDVGRGA